jgi:hypothetical protein
VNYLQLMLGITLGSTYFTAAARCADLNMKFQRDVAKGDRDRIKQKLAEMAASSDYRRDSYMALREQEAKIKPSFTWALVIGVFWPICVVFIAAEWVLDSGKRRAGRIAERIESVRLAEVDSQQDYKDRVAFWTEQLAEATDFVAREIAQENLRFLHETEPVGVLPKDDKLQLVRDIHKPDQTYHSAAIYAPEPVEAEAFDQVLQRQEGEILSAMRSPLSLPQMKKRNPPPWDSSRVYYDHCRYCAATKPEKHFAREGTCRDCEQGLWT